MSKPSKNIEVTRVQTTLGLFVVVSHEAGVRAGQVFAARTSGNQDAWYALCADWYGAGIPAIASRVPESGGYSSLDDLEQAIVEELGVQMKTGYWADR